VINWKRNINFSKGDRAVLLLITIILVLLYGYNFLYVPKMKHQPSNIKLESILFEKDLSTNSIENKKYQKLATYDPQKSAKYPPIKYTKFDPNLIDSLEWLQLGVRPWVIKSILKQRRGGWKYYNCDKLGETYNLPDSVYQKIRPYCYITVKKKTKRHNQKKAYISKIKTPDKEIQIEYSTFDPNTLDSVGWLRLGLKPWMVKTLMKQRRNGWTYYSCDKLKAIYKLPDSVYQNIRPYCSIISTQKKPKSRSSFNNDRVVNLNTASLEELQSLKGIGPYYATQIQEYRSKLGGFHSVEQLTEVYGIKPEVISNNKKRILVTGIQRQLSLNAPKDSLAAHPYVRYKLAKHITRYKQQHGAFSSVTDLKKLIVISDSLYNKLYPYLKI